MAKVTLDFQLQVMLLKEKKRFIAYAPSLDLSTSGKTIKEATHNFGKASLLFLGELVRRGTMEEVLNGMGWEKKAKKGWLPPLIVSQQSETIRVPVNA